MCTVPKSLSTSTSTFILSLVEGDLEPKLQHVNHFSQCSIFLELCIRFFLNQPKLLFWVVYEVQFFSHCVMGRLLFLTHNKRGDFMLRVIKWKLHGKICFTLNKTHHEKGTIVTVFDCSLN